MKNNLEYKKIMDLKIKILKDKEKNLMVSSPYNPQFVEKIKTIKGHRWYTYTYKENIGVFQTLLEHWRDFKNL
jgi:hypothetical protein